MCIKSKFFNIYNWNFVNEVAVIFYVIKIVVTPFCKKNYKNFSSFHKTLKLYLYTKLVVFQLFKNIIQNYTEYKNKNEIMKWFF